VPCLCLACASRVQYKKNEVASKDLAYINLVLRTNNSCWRQVHCFQGWSAKIEIFPRLPRSKIRERSTLIGVRAVLGSRRQINNLKSSGSLHPMSMFKAQGGGRRHPKTSRIDGERMKNK
jgi:hypothetical protein